MQDKHDSKQTLLHALHRYMLGSTVYAEALGSEDRYIPWNDGEFGQPLARVECTSVSEIQTALRVAAGLGIPVSVASGRHDPYGRPKHNDCLIVDLKRLHHVAYSAATGTVTVSGGATTGDLLGALPADVVTATGTNAEIGIAGITSGGGYGMLNSRLGMVCDLVARAELVLADGRAVIADRDQNPDLFWAIRGGGTGFGVVTSLTFRTHRIPQVWNAIFRVPMQEAEQALLLSQQLIDDEPERLSAIPTFMTGPDGERALFLWFLWSGESPGEQKVSRAVMAVAGAQVLQRDWVPYNKTMDAGVSWPWGRRWVTDTRLIARIDETVAAMMVQDAREMPSPDSVLVSHDFHGAPTRVAVETTAFPLRTSHYAWLVAGHWQAGDERAAEAQRAWVHQVAERVTPLALQGGYINFLSPKETDRVQRFFGASAERLHRIKREVDPHDSFVASTGRFVRAEKEKKAGP